MLYNACGFKARYISEPFRFGVDMQNKKRRIENAFSQRPAYNIALIRNTILEKPGAEAHLFLHISNPMPRTQGRVLKEPISQPELVSVFRLSVFIPFAARKFFINHSRAHFLVTLNAPAL